jgi:hypothetical protein
MSLGGSCDDNHAEPSAIQSAKVVSQQTEGYQRWEILTGDV